MSEDVDLEGVFLPDDGTDPMFDDARFRMSPEQVKGTTTKPARPQFARTWLTCLTDRKWDELFPARTRLWLFLLIKSKEGRRPVRLSTELAQEIGLDRFAKSRALALLEAAGLVSVMRSEGKAPIVSIAADLIAADLRVGKSAQVCWQNRSGALAEPLRCVGKSAHPSGGSISTYLSTLISNNDSYREDDPPFGRWALFDIPSQPLEPRPPIPEPTRDAVYARAQGDCEQCGRSGERLELHHLHYNSQGEEEPDDLQALCRECHHHRHHDIYGKFWVDPVELRHAGGQTP